MRLNHKIFCICIIHIFFHSTVWAWLLLQFLNSCNMQILRTQWSGLQYYHITYRPTITFSSVPMTCTICEGALISSRHVRWNMLVISDPFFLFRRLRGKLTDRVCSCDISIVTGFHVCRSQMTCFSPEK